MPLCRKCRFQDYLVDLGFQVTGATIQRILLDHG
jgi:hypothetical protein